MKNLKFIKFAMLMSTSIILVGCQKENNEYENKTLKVTETTREYSQPTTIEESTTKIPETTIIEQTTKEQVPTTLEQMETTTQKIEETTIENIMKDEEVINYIKNLRNEITESTEAITIEMENGFIKVVDFLFYNGEIGGRTFESLTDDAKRTILEVYDTLYTYLEEEWPTLMESLGEKYEKAKEVWDDKKTDLLEAWQSGKQKVKTWYENFKDENE